MTEKFRKGNCGSEKNPQKNSDYLYGHKIKPKNIEIKTT
jgi:hypothetical protein